MTKADNLKNALANTSASRRTASYIPMTKTASESRGDQANTTQISVRFPSDVKKQLKLIALEQDKTQHQCFAEALNMFFAAHGKAEIAPAE